MIKSDAMISLSKVGKAIGVSKKKAKMRVAVKRLGLLSYMHHHQQLLIKASKDKREIKGKNC